MHQREGWCEAPPFVLHVLRCVGEGRTVLRGGVLGSVRRHVAQDHHHRAVRVHSLRHTEVVDAVVGNDVCQVVLGTGQTCATQTADGWWVSARKSVD